MKEIVMYVEKSMRSSYGSIYMSVKEEDEENVKIQQQYPKFERE